MRLWSRYSDQHSFIAVNAAGDVLAREKNAANDEMAECHDESTVDQERTATGFVDIKEYEGREDDEERVLDTRGDEIDVAS